MLTYRSIIDAYQWHNNKHAESDYYPRSKNKFNIWN